MMWINGGQALFEISSTEYAQGPDRSSAVFDAQFSGLTY